MREVGRTGVVGRGRGKGTKLYLNNNKKMIKFKKLRYEQKFINEVKSHL